MPAAAAGAHASQAVAMRVSHKMWLLMGLAACLVVAQYHVSTTWLQSPLAGEAAAAASSEEVLRAAIHRLRHAPHRLPEHLVHELARELGCSPAALAAAPASASAPAASPSPSPPPPPQPPPPPPQRTVYVITPTYRRPEQLPELTRMAQTLMHVPALHWLVIEDAARTTPLVTELLARTGIPHDHLVAPMPEEYKMRKGAKPRGVSNRNRGLQWIRANATTGVLYFADDDNTYDIQLFEEIRSTQRVAMWPVGLCTKYGLSTPVVADGKFKGFYDGWVAGRKFPVDMAGFAVSVEFLRQRPKASMPYKPGFEEDGFLKSLAPFEPHEIELKANNCTKVFVWHTQTKKNEASAALDMKKYNNTNLVLLKKIIV